MSPREVRLPVAWGELAGLRRESPGRPRVIALHGWLDNAASFVPLASHLHGLDLVAIARELRSTIERTPPSRLSVT